jgi:putative protease
MEKEAFKTPLAMRISGSEGEAPVLHAKSLRDGREAQVTLDAPLARATQAPTDRALLEEKLGRLGETPFELDALDVDLPKDVIVPMSSLNRARRAVVAALDERAKRAHATTNVTSAGLVARSTTMTPERALPGGLFVLCRNLDQARAALASGADGVWLDFLELTGTGAALRALRDEGARFVGVAPPRIRKPGEEKIDRYLQDLEPDAILVRGLGALREGSRAPKVGDFSLNVTNRLSAAEVMRRGLSRFTPSFDLDETQLGALLDDALAPLAEVVVHHPMPLFHMEHCVIAALLSNGSDYKTCGRPCEKHQVALQDRAGMVHPVEADVGCRNTVFHAAAQSAASLVPMLLGRGVSRFRVELVREDAAQVAKIVGLYKELIASKREPSDVVRALRVGGGYGVVRGSLRVVHSP